MSARRRAATIRLLAVAMLFAAGIASAAYVLLHERLAPPLRDSYDINAELSAANGVVPGLGQPVNVAGVQVGAITGARVVDGRALITLRIDSGQLPRVYANATVTLAPLTPLGDVAISLSPGAPPARALAGGATIGASQSVSPVALEDLMQSLDGDTRTWLRSLIASIGEGTGGRGRDLQAALRTLGPSARQLGQITSALATRRRDLAELVHDLALVTHAASQDGELPQLVSAGDRAMRALADQAAPLQQAITLLPGSVSRLDATLGDLRTFAGELGPTLTDLLPAVRRLPETLAAVRPFAREAGGALAERIRPFVRRAAPLVGALAPAARGLAQATPAATSVLQTLTYFVNELAYNPQTQNQGYLYWMDWFFHNWDSVFSSGDADGVSPRADVLVDCNILNALGQAGRVLQTAMGAAKVC